jgi:hypothetical protein
MLCPKCGYNSFEYNKICPQCHKDLSAVRRQLFLTGPMPAGVNFFNLTGKNEGKTPGDATPPYPPQQNFPKKGPF